VTIFAIVACAFGPHTPIVHMPDVLSVNVTEPSVGMLRVNQYLSRPPSNAPVMTRKCSSPRRMIVRSERKPAVGGEQRRVDRAADRHVARVDGHPVEEGERARPLEVELVEGREVDHADVLTHVHVLAVDDRRPPAGVPLVLARLDATGTRRPGRRSTRTSAGAPSRGRRRTRAERLFAGVERAAAQAALAGPLLARVDDAVGLVEVLGAAGVDVVLGLLVLVEAGDVGAVRVDSG
jgi:hypothetical protein